jgi:chromosome segregation ATPase
MTTPETVRESAEGQSQEMVELRKQLEEAKKQLEATKAELDALKAGQTVPTPSIEPGNNTIASF